MGCAAGVSAFVSVILELLRCRGERKAGAAANGGRSRGFQGLALYLRKLREIPLRQLAGLVGHRRRPVAEELGDKRERSVRDRAGVREPLDRRAVGEL